MTTETDETERFEVQRTIAADPAAIFAVVSDPHGHVAIDSSGMLQDATGEPATAVGDTFVVHMDRESLNDFPLGLYDVTVEITTFEQDREIAWTIKGQLEPHIGHFQMREPLDQRAIDLGRRRARRDRAHARRDLGDKRFAVVGARHDVQLERGIEPIDDQLFRRADHQDFGLRIGHCSHSRF
jgi:hypothetical protein